MRLEGSHGQWTDTLSSTNCVPFRENTRREHCNTVDWRSNTGEGKKLRKKKTTVEYDGDDNDDDGDGDDSMCIVC